MVDENEFRADLYYRLHVFPLSVPPLRERREDIPLLVKHFLTKAVKHQNAEEKSITAEAMTAMANYSWPGNVRELENFIERAVILSRGPNLRAPLGEIRANAAGPGGDSTLEQVERDHVVRILRETGGVISKAAARLGIPRTTLNAMMKKLGISRKDL